VSNEIPDGWPGIVGIIGSIVVWFMTLERRLSNKLDRGDIKELAQAAKELADEVDEKREKERERIDRTFKEVFERMDHREQENAKFRHEIKESLNDIKVQLAQHGFRERGKP